MGETVSKILGFNTDPPKIKTFGAEQAAMRGIGDTLLGVGDDLTNWGAELATDIRASISDADTRLAGYESTFGDMSTALSDRYTNEFAPLESRYAEIAKDWDSVSRREEDAGIAASETAQQIDASRQAAERALSSYGIDPSSGRFAALQTSLAANKGAAVADAANNARRNTELTGAQLIRDAAVMGGDIRRGAIDTAGAAAGLSQARTSNYLTGVNAMTNARTAGLPAYSGAAGAYGGSVAAGEATNRAKFDKFTAENEARGAGLSLLASGAGTALGAYAAMNPATAPVTPAVAAAAKNADGGIVKKYNNGGEVGIPVGGRQVLGPGDGVSDSIPAVIDGQQPAALSTGEYVIPADVVQAKGTEFFDKLVERYHTPAAQQRGAQ